jgi:SAM-dependent methyltransferase
MTTLPAHYAESGLADSVLAAIERELGDGPLTVDQVGQVAEFHTAGRAATLALADAAGLRKGMRVLDAGAGAGGPALVLAERYGCRVTALDLTPDFCRLAQAFAERTGLADHVEVVQGDALKLPFADGSFDAVWTQHVQMNISDKPRFYRGLRRVLQKGGTLAFWDIVAGDGTPIHLPVPWASEASQSFLAGFDELRKIVVAAGFAECLAEDGTDEARAFLRAVTEAMADGPPPLSVDLLIPNGPPKFESYGRNITEGKVRLLRGVYTAV